MVPDDEAPVRQTSATVQPEIGESPLRYDRDDIADFLMKHVQKCT